MKLPVPTLFLACLVTGCGGPPADSATGLTTEIPTYDADGDGYDVPRDCDDDDPSIHPKADDPWYDGVDSNCDGADDFDADGDGHASAAEGAGADCDDANAEIHPDQTERCNGIDDDCDGTIDGPDAANQATFSLDADGDGFGTTESSESACEVPTGNSTRRTDCDDTDDTVYPGAPGVLCDGKLNDCNGSPETMGAVFGGTQYPSLDDALTAAASTGTIELCEGLATARVLTQGSLTLLGAGRNLSELQYPGGPVVRVSSGGTVSLSDAAVTDSSGGFTVSGTLNLTRVDVRGHDAPAIDAAGRATLNLVETVIEGNDTNQGAAGIDAGTGAVITMDASVVRDNYSERSIGGIGLASDVILIATNGSEVAGNRTDTGFASGVRVFGGTSLTGLVIRANEDSIGTPGPALEINGDNVTVTDVELVDNVGSAVGVGGSAVFTRVRIDGNSGRSTGSAIDINASNPATLELVDCAVTNNDSTQGDGVLYLRPIPLGGWGTHTLISTNTDWGRGATDNAPGDIWIEATGTRWDEDGVGTFQCDNTDCR